MGTLARPHDLGQECPSYEGDSPTTTNVIGIRVYLMSFRCSLIALATLALLLADVRVYAQETMDDPGVVTGITFSNPVENRYQVGVRMAARDKSAFNMLVTLPVPNDWPEQKVTLVSEEVPPEIDRVKFRELNSGVKQLVFNVSKMRPGVEVKLLMTYEVTTSQINAPEDTSVFIRPKKSHRDGKPYTGTSKRISFGDSKLKKHVKELVADQPNAWSEVRAIYDWVRENIEQREGDPRDTVDVFRDKYGCAEDITGLFIAMCRATKIPARTVWVQGQQYAEFMLTDADKNAHWFPCTLVGLPEFGSISEPRLILQKGDSIRVPEKEQRQKFVTEFAVCKGTVKPVVVFVREFNPAE